MRYHIYFMKKPGAGCSPVVFIWGRLVNRAYHLDRFLVIVPSYLLVPAHKIVHDTIAYFLLHSFQLRDHGNIGGSNGNLQIA